MTDATPLPIGFVGLGTMGGPMALRIAAAGLPLLVYDVRPEAYEPFRETRAGTAASLRDLGTQANVVCICVVNDAQVEEVVAAVMEGMAGGGTIVVHSTIHPATCRRLAAVCAARGVTLIDAQISGGGAGAVAGTLSVMVGGDAATFERCRPIFEAIGKTVRLLGPVGSGALAKLLNNGAFAANLRLIDEAINTGAAMGLDRRALVDVLASGSGGSFALRRRAGDLAEGRPLAEGRSHLLEKDCALLLDVLRAEGRSDGRLPQLITDLMESAEG